MTLHIQRGTPVIEGMNIPLDLAHIVVRLGKPEMRLELMDWTGEGLKISIIIDRRRCSYNSERYPDRETALKAYETLLEQVQRGNYVLELSAKNYPEETFRLRLLDEA